MSTKRKGKYKWVDKTQAYELFCTKVNGKYPTLAELAPILGCHPDTLLRLSAKEEWVKRRESVIKNAQEKFEEEMQDIAKAEKYKEFQDWNLVEDVITTALQDIRQAQSNYLKETDPARKVLYLKVLKSLSYDMLNFTTSLKNAKHGKRTLLGMPTDITKGELLHDTKISASLQELQEMADFIKKNTPTDKNDTTTTPTNT